MKIFLVFTLLVFSATATAQQVLCPAVPSPTVRDAQLCWTNAAKDVNGNNLPASGPYSIVTTRIHRAQVGKNAACNFNTVTQTVNVKPDVLAKLFEGLPKDTKQCFRIRHISKDAAGAELYGTWSKTVCKITTTGAKCTVPTAQAASSELMVE